MASATHWHCTGTASGTLLSDMTLPVGHGRTMIINLESWETGYADGHLGRPYDCLPELDVASYSIGFRAGCACRDGVRKEAPRLRYPLLSIEISLRRDLG